MRGLTMTSSVLVAMLAAAASAVADDRDGGAAPAPTQPPPAVEVGKPELSGGEVELLDEMLERTRGGVASCVGRHDGLSARSGAIRMQFLVRERGRAEGVEVKTIEAVAPAAGRCVQRLLKNRWVGTPSADPVAVVVDYHLTRMGEG